MGKDNVIPFPKQQVPDNLGIARERALYTRRQRAGVLANLRSGMVSMQTLLENSADPLYGKIRVSTALNNLPGIGPARRESILLTLGIDSKRRISGLGPRQREKLLRLVG